MLDEKRYGKGTVPQVIGIAHLVLHHLKHASWRESLACFCDAKQQILRPF